LRLNLLTHTLEFKLHAELKKPKKLEASKEKPMLLQEAKLLFKVLLQDNQFQFLLKLTRKYSNNTEEELSEQMLDVELTLIMLSFLLVTEVKEVLNTGFLKTHGELHGEKEDTSDLKATEMAMEFVVFKRALMFPPSENFSFKINIYF